MDQRVFKRERKEKMVEEFGKKKYWEGCNKKFFTHQEALLRNNQKTQFKSVILPNPTFASPDFSKLVRQNKFDNNNNNNSSSPFI